MDRDFNRSWSDRLTSWSDNARIISCPSAPPHRPGSASYVARDGRLRADEVVQRRPADHGRGRRRLPHGRRRPALHRRSLGRLRGRPRASQRRDRRRDRAPAADSRLLLADHDDERPDAARRRGARPHWWPLRRLQTVLQRLGGDRRRPQAGAAVPPPDRTGRAVQGDLLLPLVPRRDDGCARRDGLAKAPQSVRAARHGLDPRAATGADTVPRVPGWAVLARLLRAARDVVELEGPSTVSALILEPVLLTAGVVQPPREYFTLVRESATRPACSSSSTRS